MSTAQLKSNDDVDAILKIALRASEPSSDELRDRLTKSAEELGISPEQLADAEARYQTEGALARFQSLRISLFRQRAVTAGLGCVLMILIGSFMERSSSQWMIALPLLMGAVLIRSYL